MPASASRIQVGSGERRLLLLLSALVAFGPLSIDMYLPSLPAIAADLGASDAQVQRSISGFLVGFCVGMLFYGPLSDRFGRRPVLLAGIALYLFSSLACALADSAGQLVLLRVLRPSAAAPRRCWRGPWCATSIRWARPPGCWH